MSDMFIIKESVDNRNFYSITFTKPVEVNKGTKHVQSLSQFQLSKGVVEEAIVSFLTRD